MYLKCLFLAHPVYCTNCYVCSAASAFMGEYGMHRCVAQANMQKTCGKTDYF